VRIAVISDVHANLYALEAVLGELERDPPDEIWCLGDTVGYGPRPNECCDLVRERCSLALVGNHDLVVLGAAGVADEQRIAREDEPRVVYAGVVGDEVGVVRSCVAWRRDGLELGVAEHDSLAVGESMVLELDSRSLRQVSGRAGPLDQRRQPGNVVGLHVGLDDGRDPGPLGLGAGDVLVDEIHVRVDDRERPLALAAQQVGGAGGFVVE